MTSGGFFDFDGEMRRYRKQFKSHIFVNYWLIPLSIIVIVLFIGASLARLL